MRAWKLTRPLAGVLALVGVLALIQPLLIYHRSSAFDDYLKREIWRIRVADRLKDELLDRARDYALPVNEEDIKITETGSVFRVDVDHQAPINLLIYEPQLKFHSMSAGLVRE